MKYLKTLLLELIIFFSLTLIETILYYFNIISSNLNHIFKIIIFIITFIVSGVCIAKKSNKKYYIEGIKITLINILLITILSLIINHNVPLKLLISYGLIIILTIVSSIISGNIKKDRN